MFPFCRKCLDKAKNSDAITIKFHAVASISSLKDSDVGFGIMYQDRNKRILETYPAKIERYALVTIIL